MGMFDFIKKKKKDVLPVPSAPAETTAPKDNLDTKVMPPLDMPNFNAQSNPDNPIMDTPSDIPNVAPSLNSQELKDENLEMPPNDTTPISDIPPINVNQDMDAPPTPSSDLNLESNSFQESMASSVEEAQVNNLIQDKEEVEFPIPEESDKINELNLEPAASDEMPISEEDNLKNIAPLEPLKLNEMNTNKSFSEEDELSDSMDPTQNLELEKPVFNKETIEEKERPVSEENLAINKDSIIEENPELVPNNEENLTPYKPEDLSPTIQTITEPISQEDDYDSNIEEDSTRFIRKQIVNDSLFVNVDTFKEISELVNGLGNESKIAEESLLRIKDITLSKEKVYDKWRINLEQIEHELIQLDKLLFNV